MARLRLIHWTPAEAKRQAIFLRRAGHTVDASRFEGPPSMTALRRRPPDAIVIDLTRQPMQGRDLGLAVRQATSTRCVAIVFVDGLPEKVARVQQSLPDATFTPWSRVRGAIRNAIANPPKDPVVPSSAMAGYAGTPLPKKLGLKPGGRVALVGAPKAFAATLGPLPKDARVVDSRAKRDLTLWFVKRQSVLRREIKRMGKFAGGGGLWIVWPKQGTGIATDVTQVEVRKVGLASGLVDFKIAKIDDAWAGLRFSQRK